MTQRPIINDIIPPTGRGSPAGGPPKKQHAHAPLVFETPQAPLARAPRRKSLGLFLFFTGTIVFLTLGAVALIGYQKLDALRLTTSAELHTARAAALALNTHDAGAALAPLAATIATLAQYHDSPTISRIASFLETLSPKITNARDGFRALSTLATSTLHFFTLADTAARESFGYAFHGGGSKLLALLNSLRADIDTIQSTTDELSVAAIRFHIPLPQDALTIGATLGNASVVTSRVVSILGSLEPQHLLLLFQNPSEIRPGGGFLGSYADITIYGGNVTNIGVRDIYDPDGQLTIKTISPRPLQRISPRWGARDANWFFDFPTSAAKVISFLEQSKIYSERGTTFIGAVAVNVGLVQDLLAATGPIALPDYGLTVTAENFLPSIQREVEAGEDKKAGQPKRVLGVLAPLLLAQLADLNDVAKRMLGLRLKDRIRTKDIQFYSRDRALELYLQTLGVGGDVYAPETPDYDDYFAFVRANIAGGKTDVFIDETVALESTIDGSGVVTNALTVSRAHHGDKEQGWWYRMANRLFFQVLTPYDSSLMAMRGNDMAATPTIIRKNYVSDPDVTAIESTLKLLDPYAEQFAQFGKTTFAGWFTVPAGEAKKLTLEYQLPGHVALVDGTRYRMVIEKQSGSHEHFTYTLHAPPGFIWKEKNAHDITFASNDLDGRMILTATLARQ